MEEKKSFFEETEDIVRKYVNDRVQLIKLQMAEKVANLTALLVTGAVLGVLAFFILIFLSIMAGYFFAERTGSLFYGFGIIALVYILLLILVIVLRKNVLHNLIANTVIRIFFDKQTDDDDDEHHHGTGTSETPPSGEFVSHQQSEGAEAGAKAD